MSFKPSSLFFSKARDHFYWILRRANSGFFSGLVAWLFIPALSRVLSKDTSPLLLFFATGVLGGSFLGAVDGMVEDSSTKTYKGILFGGLGGGLSGLLFSWLSKVVTSEMMPVALFTFWGLTGAAIGLVSAIWERSTKKTIAGVVSGLIGGGMGGTWGYMMFGFITQSYGITNWWAVRALEGLSGGIIGISLWFCIGTAERFVIFKRRFVQGQDHKFCEHCKTKNPLQFWYCGHCGYVLQEAAPAASLNLSPYTTLERIKEMFRFLSRLSSTTGLVAGAVVFFVFAPADPFLALLGMVLVSGVSYTLLIVFSALAESLQIFVKK